MPWPRMAAACVSCTVLSPTHPTPFTACCRSACSKARWWASCTVLQKESVGTRFGLDGRRLAQAHPNRRLHRTRAGMLLTHYSPNGTYWIKRLGRPKTIPRTSPKPRRCVVGRRQHARLCWGNVGCMRVALDIGPLGTWSNDALGLGVHNDDLFDDVLSIGRPHASGSKWTCNPNPASDITTLVPPRAGLLPDTWTWTLVDARGMAVSSGTGNKVDVSRCATGMHTVLVQSGTQRIHVNVLVASAR